MTDEREILDQAVALLREWQTRLPYMGREAIDRLLRRYDALLGEEATLIYEESVAEACAEEPRR